MLVAGIVFTYIFVGCKFRGDFNFVDKLSAKIVFVP